MGVQEEEMLKGDKGMEEYDSESDIEEIVVEGGR